MGLYGRPWVGMLPIHHFEYIGHGNANYPYMFVGYRKLGGVALEDESITPEQLAALAPTLAAFLSELHSFPIVQAVQAAIKEHTPSQWRERYQELYTDLSGARLSAAGCGTARSVGATVGEFSG